MDQNSGGAGGEWQANWTLPIAAMLGYSVWAIPAYSIGAFIVPLETEFGWSRTEIMLGLTITSLIQAALSVIVGLVVDRLGSRRLGIVGIIGITSAFALAGTATGSITNWLMLWVLLGIASLFAQPTVWVKPVAIRFERSRGLALAVVLSGSGIAATVFPLLSNWLVGWLGWRAAFPALGAIWALLVLPIALLFFRTDERPRIHGTSGADKLALAPVATELSGLTVSEALRTAAFYKLLVASLLFVLTAIGVIIHFVPILTEQGASPLRAAANASLIGIAAVGGRLATGFLIDRFPADRVGTVVFVFPVVASLLLILNGADPFAQAAAAICFGVTLGAEVDVIAYLTTRYLGLRHYGVLFGAMMGAVSLGVAVGPLTASWARDWWGSYDPFLMAAVGCAAISCLCIATLGRPRFLSGH